MVARIWHFHHCNPASVCLGTQAPFQAVAGQGHRDHIHKCEVAENDQVQKNIKLILKERERFIEELCEMIDEKDGTQCTIEGAHFSQGQQKDGLSVIMRWDI